MQKTTVSGLELQRALSIDGSSYNEADNTIEVTFSSEAPVLTYLPYPIGERAYEILSHDPNHVRIDRISKGIAPVLDNHDKYSGTKAVLGRVISGKIENREGVATLKFSKRKAVEGTIQDVKEGILTQISAGYRVYAYQLIRTASATEPYPTYMAVDWEPMEVSFAPVNADINSLTRSADQEGKDQTSSFIILNNSTNTMENQATAPATTEQQRSAENPAATVTTPAPAATVVTDPTESQRSIAAERSRAAAITTEAAKANMPADFAQKHIAEGTDISQVRSLIIDHFAQADPFKATQQRNTAPAATVGADNAWEGIRSGIEGAILSRVNPGIVLVGAELENSRNFRGMSMLRMAEEILTFRGESVRGLTANELSKRAMGSGDFPMLLGNVMNKQLRGQYETEPEYWEKLSRQESASDFKAKGLYQVDKYNGMQEIKEHGEYNYAALLESSQTYKVKTFGEGVKFSRQMMINDDLSVLSRIPMMFNKDWSDIKGDIMWGLILDNGKFSDDKAIFHADHGNLGTGAGSALSEDSLAAARLAFRKQKDLKGKAIRVTPKYLIVGPELETKAEKLLSQIVANTTNAVNIFANKFELIVENRIQGAQWYLAGAPASADILLHAYLDGNAGLYAETITDFDTDAVKMKVRGEFGGQIVDYRALYKSVGA